MAIPKHHIGIKGDECQCGRRASLMHCIRCGSARVYARHGMYHDFGHDVIKYVETELRCQTCDMLFVPSEREFCMAAPVGAALALQKIQTLAAAAQQGEYLTLKDKKAADAISEIIGQSTLPQTAKQKYDKFRLEEYKIKNMYMDEKAAIEARGEMMSTSMEEYIESYLKKLNIERVYPPTDASQDASQEDSQKGE